MPRVLKDEEYVRVGYVLACGYQRAAALAHFVEATLKDDEGIRSASDETNGFWPDNKSLVVVWYNTLADAVRLNDTVRALLSTAGEFTYEARTGVSYGQRGAHLRVDTSTTFNPRGS